MWLLQYHGLYHALGSAVVVLITSFFTIWSVAVGFCVHSAIRALVPSGTDFGWEVQLMFQFIKNVLSRVEVRALCSRTLQFFISKPAKSCLYRAHFVMLKHVWVSCSEGKSRCFKRHSVEVCASNVVPEESHKGVMRECPYTSGHIVQLYKY